MAKTPELDKEDLGLLHDLVGLWDLAERAYAPVEWGAWETLIEAGLVEKITLGAPAIVPTVAGCLRVRKPRKPRVKAKAKPSAPALVPAPQEV